MSIASYLKEVEAAKPARIKVMHLAHKLLEAQKCRLVPTAHFLERFDLRAQHPLQAVHDFELAIRTLAARFSEAKGKKAAFKCRSSVFVFDATQDGYVRCVSYWYTDKEASVVLAGRGDFLLDIV